MKPTKINWKKLEHLFKEEPFSITLNWKNGASLEMSINTFKDLREGKLK